MDKTARELEQCEKFEKCEKFTSDTGEQHCEKFSQRPTMNTARELDQWVKKMKCSGATGLDISSFPEIKVGLDQGPVESGSPSLDPLSEGILSSAMTKEQKESRWHGELEMEGCKVWGDFQDGGRE